MNTSLVVVDMQRYFCDGKSPLAEMVRLMDRSAAERYFDRVSSTVVPNIRTLISAYRARGHPVIFTEFGSREPDGHDLPLWARRQNDRSEALIGQKCFPPLTDPLARVVEELAPTPRDLVVTKVTSGPLAGTDLAGELRAMRVESVLVAGVMTDVCVMGMARELADSDYDVFVVRDGCATFSEESHEWALRCLGGAFASVVGTSDAAARVTDADG